MFGHNNRYLKVSLEKYYSCSGSRKRAGVRVIGNIQSFLNQIMGVSKESDGMP